MITQKAYAKLNLCLQVGDVLPNGYHSVISLMDTVSLFDLVTVEKAERIQLECVGQNLSAGEDNLAHKAAVAFFKQSGIQGISPKPQGWVAAVPMPPQFCGRLMCCTARATIQSVFAPSPRPWVLMFLSVWWAAVK